MAEVFVDLTSLEAAAQHSEEASGIGGELGVVTPLIRFKRRWKVVMRDLLRLRQVYTSTT